MAMADLIDRQAAIAYAISGMTREIDGDKWIRVSEVRESLKKMPSAQSKTSRKMCWRKDVDGFHVCYDFYPTDYCSYGERR